MPSTRKISLPVPSRRWRRFAGRFVFPPSEETQRHKGTKASVMSQSMVARLRRVVVKKPVDAFRSREQIEKEWKALNYTRPPDLDRAGRDHRDFVSVMTRAGAEVLYLPADDRTGLDSLYVHDPVLVTDAGAIIFQTGK